MHKTKFIFDKPIQLSDAYNALRAKFPNIRLNTLYNSTTPEGNICHLLFVDTVEPISKRIDITVPITEYGGTFVSTVRMPTIH